MSEITEMVEAAQAPETFDFAEVVQGRGYPRDEVAIYLNEDVAYKIQALFDAKKTENNPDKLDEIDEQLAALRVELDKSKYVFKIVGFSTERREELIEAAKAHVPVEYETLKNPFTHSMQKVEKVDPERDNARDRHFTNLVWQAHIEQIVSPSGAVQTAPSLDTIESVRKLPTAQLKKLVNSFDKLQVAAEAFEQATDEDFLAKS